MPEFGVHFFRHRHHYDCKKWPCLRTTSNLFSSSAIFEMASNHSIIKQLNAMDPYNDLLPYILSGMALIGTYCLILAYEKQHEIEKVLTKGIKTSGIVTEIHQDPSGNAGDAPVVDFTTQNGAYKHFSRTYALPSAYKVGQQVEIWYYHYKSIRLAALVDDKPGSLPKTLFQWGIILCLLSYPVIIRRLITLI